MDFAIEVANLTKKYGDIVAIDNISFNVYYGEIFSYLGPNGSGKTTTVEILACIRKPTFGTAKVLGFSIDKEENEIKKRIGILPQEFAYFDLLTVKECIDSIGKIYGLKYDIKQILEVLDLWEYRNKKFKELSGGLKRRVGVAMSIVNDPDLLFLDEPTTGLDPMSRRDVWKYILNLKKLGKTIFLTTHYMEEAEKLSDRIGIIVKGKMIALDNVKDLIAKFGGNFKLIIYSNELIEEKIMKILKNHEYNFVKKENMIICNLPSKSEANLLASDLIKNDIENFEIKNPSIEDVFLNLAGYRISETGELA
ncbi:MAG: ABC transporter ATP-binding protein [Thermoproteota archaeon]|jgi:ABC-2 type transport system ATP-binding protein|nr:ABC transporter ATP-binding protein [Thermoproteota archaeon]